MFICHICAAPFTRKDVLDRHLSKHKSVELSPQLKCKTCYHCFGTMGNFQRYKKKIKKKKTHTFTTNCPTQCECRRAFRRKDALKRHKANCSTPKPKVHAASYT